MWELATEVIDGRTRRVTATRDGVPVTMATVIEAWCEDAAFREVFDVTLAAAPFEAFFWETPALTRATVGRAFECVLVDAPTLVGVAPEPRVFSEHGDDGEGVVTFPNLNGDAVLVAPCALQPPSAGAHLAAFVRAAPVGVRHAFWSAVGAALTARLGSRPVWTSTSGLGVSWLHLRLDDRPKYYTHAPYRLPPE